MRDRRREGRRAKMKSEGILFGWLSWLGGCRVVLGVPGVGCGLGMHCVVFL